MKPIKDAVYDAFMIQGVGYNEMSLDDIALEIQDKDLEYKDYDLDELRKKISSYMSNATTKIVKGKRIENKESLYERVKNGKGGYKKGVYKLRKPKKISKPLPPSPPLDPITDPIPSINTLYIGSAGEMAVCSELLFREYNVSRMSVDDGIDVIALKNNKTYYIQVKTVQVKSENFSVKISSKSFYKYCSNDCYYIVVARTKIKEKFVNQFIIMTADNIKALLNKDDAKDKNGIITLNFSQYMGNLFIKTTDVNYMLNSFDRIL